MQNKKRIQARLPMRSLLCSALMLGLLLLQLWNVVDTERIRLAVCAVGAGLCVFWALWDLTHGCYLNPKGVEAIHFGRVVSFLPWDQVAEVAMVHESKNSSISALVITPAGCELFDRTKWSGLGYAFHFRDKIFLIDNSRQNREYIEKHFGGIIDKYSS